MKRHSIDWQARDLFEDPAGGWVEYDDARAVIDGLQALLNERDEKLARYAEFLAWCESAPVGSGVCCCGGNMESHGHYADHGAVDEWDHSLGNWAKELRG